MHGLPYQGKSRHGDTLRTMREQDNLGRGTAVNNGEPRHGGIDRDPIGAKIATVMR